ncbi:hypothetical protein DTW90_30120 [Neorhizobium sp. P12A]|nr:hypothetical protein DTW90_30120 [Neorhizobium sp. P12A]
MNAVRNVRPVLIKTGRPSAPSGSSLRLSKMRSNAGRRVMGEHLRYLPAQSASDAEKNFVTENRGFLGEHIWHGKAHLP